MPPGQMCFVSPPARCRVWYLGRSAVPTWRKVRRSSACGLEADLPDRLACGVTAEAVAPGVVVEGWRDPHAAHQLSVALRERAAGSFAADMAGPGVAGAAGRDAADRLPRRDTAPRHARHRLALASGHPSSPLGASQSLRTPAGAPQCAVGGAAAGPGERVMGVPPHSWRAGRARHHGSGVDGIADSQECGDRPGAAPGWAGLAGVLAISRRRRSWRWTLHRRSPQRREGLRLGRNRAWHPPRPGSRRHRAPGPVLGRASRPGTCSWTWKMPGRG